MNCPICGAPIAEGAAFCNNCGSPVAQQPQQGIQYQQPNQQYQQPGPQYQQPDQQFQQQYQQPGPMYQQDQQFRQPASNFGKPSIGDLIKDPFMICTFVGFFFLFISAWFPRWVQAKGAGGVGLLAADGGILKLYAFLFFLIIVWGVITHLNLIPNAVQMYRSLPFSQFYLPGLALIVWILCMTNSSFRLIVDAGKAAKLLGYTGKTAGYGFIAWLCLIAVILLLVRPVMKLVKKEQYWDF
jgi:hypothetical protein